MLASLEVKCYDLAHAIQTEARGAPHSLRPTMAIYRRAAPAVTPSTPGRRKTKALPPDVLAYFRKVGSQGGKATAAKLSPAERTARASKGGQAKQAKRLARLKVKGERP